MEGIFVRASEATVFEENGNSAVGRPLVDHVRGNVTKEEYPS
jgi:hypothetical protein